MCPDLTIAIGVLTALVSVAGVIVWDICRDRSQRRSTLRGGYKWLAQELIDNKDWIVLNRAVPDSKEKADAKTRLESRGLLPGMSTVSVGALHYVITSAGPTRLMPTDVYRALVTLEDTLSILKDDLRTDVSYPTRAAGVVGNHVRSRIRAGMELALKQIDEARQMVDGQIARWWGSNAC